MQQQAERRQDSSYTIITQLPDMINVYTREHDYFTNKMMAGPSCGSSLMADFAAALGSPSLPNSNAATISGVYPSRSGLFHWRGFNPKASHLDMAAQIRCSKELESSPRVIMAA